MLGKLFGAFSHDIGIDLGTANTLVFVRNQGIVINEPSVVAVNDKTKQILAIGEAARQMVGRTPSHIVAIRPLVSGVVSDFEITEQMLRYFIDRVHKESFTLFPRPRVVVGIPSGVTEVEKKAVEDAARIAGDKLNEDIVQYAKDNFNLLLGLRTAERIKWEIGNVYETRERAIFSARGRDLVTGLPKEIQFDERMVRDALMKSAMTIAETVKITVEQTPPELVADIMERGIVLAGGGALLRGLDKLIADHTHMPVYVTEEPLSAVVRGTGQVLENIDTLREVLGSTEDRSALR